MEMALPILKEVKTRKEILSGGTFVYGISLSVAAVTWILVDMFPTEMPSVARLTIQICMIVTGVTFGWLGKEINKL